MSHEESVSNSELSKKDFSRSPDSQQSRNVRIYFSQRASDFQPTSSHGSGVSAAVSDPNHLSSLLFLQLRVSLFFFLFSFCQCIYLTFRLLLSHLQHNSLRVYLDRWFSALAAS